MFLLDGGYRGTAAAAALTEPTSFGSGLSRSSVPECSPATGTFVMAELKAIKRNDRWRIRI
jgi:hypothetical protein